MPKEEEEKNGRVSVATILTIVGLVVPPMIVWGDGEVKRGELVNRVSQLEKRAEEDRKDSRQAVSEVTNYAKTIDANVQIILQKITAMEARQQAQARRENTR